MRKPTQLVFGVLTLFAFSLQAAAAPKISLSGPENPFEKSANEFVLRRFQGERLIPIRVLGGVTQPGTYYVPVGTDFLSLISLAGGLAPNTDSSRIQFRQWNTKVNQEIDLDDSLKDPVKFNPGLDANDLIFVPEQKPAISNNTLIILTTVATVLGIALASIAIRKETR